MFSALETIPLIPAADAWDSSAESACRVQRIKGTSGTVVLRMRAASRPLITGIIKSSTATSGLESWIFRTPSLPSAASSHTTHDPSADSRIFRNSLRITALSSTITILFVTAMPCPNVTLLSGLFNPLKTEDRFKALLKFRGIVPESPNANRSWTSTDPPFGVGTALTRKLL